MVNMKHCPGAADWNQIGSERGYMYLHTRLPVCASGLLPGIRLWSEAGERPTDSARCIRSARERPSNKKRGTFTNSAR